MSCLHANITLKKDECGEGEKGRGRKRAKKGGRQRDVGGRESGRIEEVL